MKLEFNTTQVVELAKKQADELADNSRIKVVSGPTFEKAKEQLKQVKTIKKFVKEKKESITKPLNEALKNTRALFSPIEEKILVIEKYLNGEILSYNQKLLAEQKQREEEAMRKLAEEESKRKKAEQEAENLRKELEEKEKAGGEVTEEEKEKINEVEKEAEKEIDIDKILKKTENTTEKLNQIRTRKVTKLKITDKTKIPYDYLVVDEVALKRALISGEKIDGAELYEEEIAVNSY
jgi:hypothetical protein